MFNYEDIQTLNELELEVYNYVISNPEKTIKMKIRELADECHVSTTTILRFCKKFNCEGFVEFKLLLKMTLNEKDPQIKENDLDFLVNYIQSVKQEEYQNLLDRTAEFLASKNFIWFYGIGTSGILGNFGARLLSNIGKYSQCIDDPFYPIPNHMLDEGVIVVLSVSGETKEVIDKIRYYKSKKATIVSITNNGMSILAKLSDISINYYMPEVILGDKYNVTTQVPVMVILEQLALKVRQIITDGKL